VEQNMSTASRVLQFLSVAIGLAAGASAQQIGINFSGACVAGNCPPSTLALNTSAILNIVASVTLANGDIYDITGSVMEVNSRIGQISFSTIYQVTYTGNGKGGASQADTLSVDVLTNATSSIPETTFGEPLVGSFSPTISSGSSAQLCLGGVCDGPVVPPGDFSTNAQVTLGPSNGMYSLDYAYTIVFGAGSPPGSYVVLGQDDPLNAPSILSGGIVNAASYAQANGAGSPVAPGSLVAIFTSILATQVANFTTPSLPDLLNGVSATFNGIPAPIVSVSPTGANPYVGAQVPFEVLAAGQTSATVPVVVTVRGIGSPPVQTLIVPSAPGIFTIPPTGQGNAILVFLNPATNAPAIAAPANASIGYPVAPIPRGTQAFFYVNGLGAMTPMVADGSGACPASNSLCNANAMPQVLIGGISAPVAFAGQAVGYPGVFQVNIMVPQNAPTGSSVPLIVKSADGSVTSNTATIAVQ
jgi:uncharacterized protein (TIGR03437 family)